MTRAGAVVVALALGACAQAPELACAPEVDRDALTLCAGRAAGLSQFALAMDADPALQRDLALRAETLYEAAQSCAAVDAQAGTLPLERLTEPRMIAFEREFTRARSIYLQSLRDKFGAFDRGLVPEAIFTPTELAQCSAFEIAAAP
jgi:hypothetical protein